MTPKLRIWLWISIVLAVAGALLLYPIGTAALNVIFILIKIGMVAGLAVLLFSRRKFGFYVWAVFCVGAVIMTIFKWQRLGSASFLIVASIAVDILAPVVAYLLMRERWDSLR